MAPGKPKTSNDWGGFGSKDAYYKAIKSGEVKTNELGAGGAKSLIIKAAQVVSRAGSKKNTLPALAKKIDKVQKVVSKTELIEEMGGYNLSTLKGRGQQALNDARFARADRKLSQLKTQQSNQLNRALNVSPQKAGGLSSRNLSADMYERAVQVEKVMKQRNVKVPKKK